MTTSIFTLLHFNLQYCAGGVEGLLVDWPSDEASIEDQIIVESFVPVLDLLERHPDWTFTIELQAYFVEVLAARHPAALEQLHRLSHAGQVELVSFHYSDQLWIAYPPRDQEVSLDRTAAVFAQHDLPLSDVVFTQEGQFALGAVRNSRPWGYRTFVLPHNLGEYAWGAEPAHLAYRYGDAVVLSGGTWESTDAWSAGWYFLDDGELFVTNGMNCYLGPAFVYDAEATAEREAELVAATEGGAVVSGVAAFVAGLDVASLPELPDVVDGTWQPDDTENVHLWMGGSGLWADTEADNDVRTTVMAARHRVAAAERFLGPEDPTVQAAWDEILLAEVSDATGWNPYTTEVAYAYAHAEAAVALAEEAMAGACGTEPMHVGSDGQLTAPDDPVVTAAEAPFAVTADGATLTWETLTWGTGDEDLRLTVTWPAGSEAREIHFPWDGASVDLLPAFEHEVRSYAPLPRARFAVPLPLGAVRLGEDWLVADTRTVHLAALFEDDLSFREETALGVEDTWAFHVVPADRAEALAWSMNADPVERFDCPPAVVPDRCGCGGGAAALLPWLGLWGLRRRRR